MNNHKIQVGDRVVVHHLSVEGTVQSLDDVHEHVTHLPDNPHEAVLDAHQHITVLIDDGPEVCVPAASLVQIGEDTHEQDGV